MNKVYNFSAGPSTMPKHVLKRAEKEMLNYNHSGQSVMEMSHRSKIFQEILEDTKSLIRNIMDIPDNYDILFLQGGASSQFAMVPLNLFGKYKSADFILTGQWSTKAYNEAKKYGDANIIASSKDKNFSYIPKVDKEMVNPNADFLFYCMNNTIYGTKFNYIPNSKNIPLVSDISSFILSEPIDVSKFGVLYACAQKNLGPAGLTIVIIRKDLLNHALSITPTMFNYSVHSEHNSLYNTPPCYCIYICKLMLEWIKDEIGSLENMKKINQQKANILYNYIDNSTLFHSYVDKSCRSLMNIPFVTKSKELDDKFIKQATLNNIINIKGHRSIGGMRASIYNAMPIEGVEFLVDFMQKFEKENS